VDPIEPCHLLRCWDLPFAGRAVDYIDARLLMTYSSTLLSSILLLRYNELVLLQYVFLLSASALLLHVAALIARCMAFTHPF